MYDYRFRFPADRWADALAYLRLATADQPANMLGDPVGADGGPVAAAEAVARARRGGAARTIQGRQGGAPIVAPARGDPGYWYIHVRTDLAPEELPADPAASGFEAVTAEESALVLGVWA